MTDWYWCGLGLQKVQQEHLKRLFTSLEHRWKLRLELECAKTGPRRHIVQTTDEFTKDTIKLVVSYQSCAVR